MRGQSQTRLNVLLDGGYVHGGCPNRMDPPSSWAALETYEKVTVLKGVQSLVYGAGGSGGTVIFERDTCALALDGGVHGRVAALGIDNGISCDILGYVVAAAEKGYLRTFAEIKNADNYENKWNMTETMRWVGNPAIESEKHHQLDMGVIKTSDVLQPGLGACNQYDR